jgi:protoporphyrinogen oxidase
MSVGETNSRVVILGAGVTGLSAGIRLLDSGCSVSILEKNDHTGGLAKTVVRGNYRLDIGPHHLFSQNETILKEILDLFESDELVTFSRDAKMYFHDRFLNYPLTARNVLLDMGIKHALMSSLSYLWVMIRSLFIKKNDYKNFHEWAKNNFGNYVYGIFFKPYTEQFWGIPCEELSVDCVPQLTKLSFFKTLKMVLLPETKKKSLSVGERESSLKLFYPKKGIGAIVEKLTDIFLAKGGVMRLNCTVSELAINGDGIFTLHYQNEIEKKKDNADHVISSIPIYSLGKILKPAPPDSVLKSADSLEYLSTIVLYIVIPDRDFLDCSYLHMMDRPYNRVSNTNRFHSDLCPEGENMAAAEITCHFNDSTWKSTDKEIFDICVKHLESDGFIYPREVKQYFVIRIKSAYPFFRLNYREHKARVFDYFEKLPGVTLAGRTGSFKYKDIDQCLEETSDLVSRFKAEGAI